MLLVESRVSLCWTGCLVLMAVVLPSSSVRAQALAGPQPSIRSRGVAGFGPDAQLVGGLGFGLGGKLNNYFLARARLGALYASAPWIVNAGLTVEVGALAGLGWGGELELSRGGGLFGTLGVARVDQSRWLLHAGLGYSIVGLEWQHTFEGPTPNDALLLQVRVPLGLWWLQKRQEKSEAKGAAAEQAPQIKRRVAQSAPRSEAAAADKDEPVRASGVGHPAAASEQERAVHLAEASRAREQGDRRAEAFALSRAYALRPDPIIALQLSAAELALGKPRSAQADLRRVGGLDQLPAAERERAEQLQRELAQALSYVRVELSGAEAETLTLLIDGGAEPIALQGYDVPLDPGEHTLELRRAERVIATRTFQTSKGALLRLSIELPP